jgi:RNA polymerase sigma-70 factor (ECF subfamily)
MQTQDPESAGSSVERSNEQWLLDLAADGAAQTSALQDLRDRLQRSIYYYLSRERSDLNHYSTGDLNQMAADLTQDALLRVIANLDSFRGDSRFTTWANKIAVRVAISDLRRARYKDFRLDDLTAEGEILPDMFNIESSLPNPESAAERSDTAAKLRAALKDALTDRQRQALEAVVLRGVPMEVVADRMDTNRNALYKLLHDARRKLRSHLEAQGLTMDYMLDLFGD